MRTKYPNTAIVNALQVGTDTEGGFLVPDEFEHTLIQRLEEENFFRRIATVIQTNSGDRKIPIVASKGTASWIDEEGLYPESDDAFGQITLSAYKLGTLIKVSEELLNDSAFNLENYIATEFGRRIGSKEEESFFIGDAVGKPTGILADTGGAEIGVTAASSTAITADEIIDLYYSLRVPYRKNAITITTNRGISIGSSKEDVIKAYGLGSHLNITKDSDDYLAWTLQGAKDGEQDCKYIVDTTGLNATSVMSYTAKENRSGHSIRFYFDSNDKVMCIYYVYARIEPHIFINSDGSLYWD